ncbi:hypothetical protein, partial [Methanobrevibacter sp.]|uniref:hypothetical protein n=1 Tax=Methanobrevibacter sp. TaxID=66852 RepID=UPI00386E6443
MILCICLIVPASFASEDISLNDTSQESSSTDLGVASDIPDSDLDGETADSQNSILKDSSNEVFVNATSGSDDNDGSDWTKAYKTIDYALNNVNSDGTINLADGVYNLTGTLNINKNVIIKGESKDGTIIDAIQIESSTIRRAISITATSTVSIDSLTIRNGWMDPNVVEYGAGINNLGTLNLENVSVINCSAYNTGGVDNSGTIIVNNCYFANNSALGIGGNKNRGRDAGALSNVGTATVINSYFTDNYATGNGAGIKNQGANLYVNNCTFVNSVSSITNGYGGAIYSWATPMQVYNSTFINGTSQFGGAIGVDQNRATVGVVYKIQGCVFINNTHAVRGGAIYIDSAQDSVINDNIFINCSADLVNEPNFDGSVIGTGAFTGHFGLTNVSIENNYWGPMEGSGFDSSLITTQFAEPNKYVDFTAPSTYVILNVSADKTELQLGDTANINVGFVNNDGTPVTAGLPTSLVTASASSGTLSQDKFNLSDNPVVITYIPSGSSTQDTVVISVDGITVFSIPMTISLNMNHIYVNATGGDDANSGVSWGNAVKTISRALSIVEADGIIHLADGIYSANSITFSKNVAFVGESQNGT